MEGPTIGVMVKGQSERGGKTCVEGGVFTKYSDVEVHHS
jgi:hypothetical protein